MGCGEFCSKVGDHLFLAFVAAPLVSMYWCGMFFLTDYYVIPTDYVTSIWVTCFVGFATVFVCHLGHEYLTKLGNKSDNIYNPLARVYSIFLIIAIVFEWRGFWYILEHYLPSGYVSAGLSTLSGVVLMALSGCSKSITGVVPFILIADDKENYFLALSKYQNLTEKHKSLKWADHFYSVFYINPSIVLIWRGLWHVQDYADHVISGAMSLGCGLAAVLTLYILQFPVNRCVKFLGKPARFLVEQTWRFLVVSAAIFYWRGTWVFFKIFFKEDLFTMWFITVSSGFLLCILNVWSIATLRGVWVDDPLDSNEDSILFDIHFFSDITNALKKPTVQSVHNEKYDKTNGLSQILIDETLSEKQFKNWIESHESDL